VKFHIASQEDIIAGKATDIYFLRTVEVLRAAGLEDARVRAEFHVASLPRGYKWAIFAGLKEALYALEGKPVTVYSLPEGSLFYENEPIMTIEGRYVDFAVFETTVLGILRHYTSIATKAARVKKAAGDRACLFFGARVLHPAVQPMADRAAYIGGCDGVAGVLGAELMGKRPAGTMPHALMIIFRAFRGDHTEAWLWFDKVEPPDVPRIVLADTFLDEREESLIAAQRLGERLWGVRLDTPGSRRGDMLKIAREVRWALDLSGHKDVKIVVSGGLDEEEVARLREVVDVFGVGTSIAFPPSVDISMDIVEAFVGGRWIPITKRGKLPGFKQIYSCGGRRVVAPWGSPPNCEDPKPLIKKYMEDGKIIERLPSEDEIRAYVLEQLKGVEP
jgi:nicotinate phosphoribosyltransferase